MLPVDAVNLDFDAVALNGEYDGVLAEGDAVKVFSKPNQRDRLEVCRKARGRANKEALAERLAAEGGQGGGALRHRGHARARRRVRTAGMVAVMSTSCYGTQPSGAVG